MPSIRRLPSGNWNAQVRLPKTAAHPNGERVSFTDPLKDVAKNDALELERDIKRNDWIHPHAGEITCGELWPLTVKARTLSKASTKRDRSHWECHVQPRWDTVQIKMILKPDVSTWVNEMRDAGVGPPTIEGCLKVLKNMLEVAVDSRMIRTNPARGVAAPPSDSHIDRVLNAEEETALLARLEAVFPGRLDARVFVEFMLDTGARWEEAAAVRKEVVDTLNGFIPVRAVMERDGTIRDSPKTASGERTLAVSEEFLPRLRLIVRATPDGEPIFRTREGKHLHYTNWHKRVWLRCLFIEEPDLEKRAAWVRPPGRSGPVPPYIRKIKYLADPQPTPHDLRHTFATRLADGGVPQHDIMTAIGHKDARATRRYLHSSAERFDRQRAALRKARGLDVEKPDDARMTHGLRLTMKKARSKAPLKGL